MLGVSHRFTKRDSAEINYNVTDMTNAIAHYTILNPKTSRYEGHTINAKRKKAALNLAYKYAFDAAWSLSISYSWVNETFSAKRFQIHPDGTNLDELINAYRPRNIYRTHLTYDKNSWFADLSYTIYSGNDTRYFSSAHFDLLDLSLNYKVAKDWQVYFNLYNILNTAYETKALSTYVPGAFPEQGRRFMISAKYIF